MLVLPLRTTPGSQSEGPRMIPLMDLAEEGENNVPNIRIVFSITKAGSPVKMTLPEPYPARGRVFLQL